MATKQDLETELSDLKRDYENALEQIDQLEKDLEYAREEVCDQEKEKDDMESERDELQELIDDSEAGSVCRMQIRGTNTLGEFLATAITKLLENGRDLDTLDLIERLGDPDKRRAAVEAIAAYELINL